MKKLLAISTLLAICPTLNAMDAASSSSLSTALQKPDGWEGEKYNKHSDPQYKSAMGIVSPMAAPSLPEDWLDLGCGTGRVSVELAKKTPGTVVGVDASESQIAKARQLWQAQTNLSFAVADGQNLSYKQQFHRIFSFAAIHWMPNKQAVFDGCYNALKPNGKLVLTLRAKDPDTTLKKAFIKTAQQQEWAMLRTINPDQQDFSVEKDELNSYLKQSGFTNIQVTERQFGDRFTPDEFIGFLGSLIGAFSSFNKLKEEKPELVKNLVAALVRNYIAISPLGDDGKLDYRLKGWGATAQKPEN